MSDTPEEADDSLSQQIMRQIVTAANAEAKGAAAAAARAAAVGDVAIAEEENAPWKVSCQTRTPSPP